MLHKTGYYKLEQDSNWSYHTFVPHSLMDITNIEIDDELNSYLIKAHRLLGELNGMIKYMPNMGLWHDLLIKYEAVLSCKPMNAKFSFSDLWNISSRISTYNDKITAFSEAIKEGKIIAEKNNISLDSIKKIHKRLIYKESPKQAGRFRKEQLFIPPKISVINAVPYFNPPNPDDMMKSLIDYEKHLRHNWSYDTLIQAALIYYQFISIQPFISGNHRMGKLLTNLFLVSKELLSLPLLLFSYHFTERESEYRHIILATRNHGGYQNWIKFFIKAVAIDSKKTVDMLNGLHNLYTEDYAKIQAIAKPNKLDIEIYQYLLKTPVVETRYIARDFGLSYNTAARSVKNLVDSGVLYPMKNQERYRKFIYKKLLDLFR